ncbi:MAG: efflux RND transporter periplasmic adaptor subunit [Phycisphaerae bacterium]|nr:efflux RND transporter periplasmic adaptor subunit [Phycisphaerae bacterium]
MNGQGMAAVIVALLVGLGAGVGVARHWPGAEAHGEHGEVGHEGHDHGDRGEAEGPEEHEGHDHAEADSHGGEEVVLLDEAQRKAIGVELSTAGAGELTIHSELPGEVALNEDRVAHIVPRAPGIVREVLKNVGDSVRSGEVMAWLESVELGQAKVDYLAKWSELGCCTIDLTRAQEIRDNTLAFLKLLESGPSLETLIAMNGTSMGENRSSLVTAYSELVLARGSYEREKALFDKKIASAKSFQAAEMALKKADASYAATRDTIGFKVRRDLAEAKRDQQVREIELKGAERRLNVLGLTADEIKRLERLTEVGTTATKPASHCSDPNCKECAKRKPEAPAADVQRQLDGERLGWYPLRAPFDGTVIQKHLTLGEKHGDEAGAFTIADLSTVWVNIRVYQKDLAQVTKGRGVLVAASGEALTMEGAVGYVSPVVDEKTRTTLARVVLANPEGRWRPGMFVKARMTVGRGEAGVVVPKTAVQRIGDKAVVFVETKEGLKATPIALGSATATHAEVTSGLTAGERYVTAGAFELKAKIVTSGLGAHAGHGH